MKRLFILTLILLAGICCSIPLQVQATSQSTLNLLDNFTGGKDDPDPGPDHVPYDAALRVLKTVSYQVPEDVYTLINSYDAGSTIITCISTDTYKVILPNGSEIVVLDSTI